jgi:hypothetical protein
MKGDTEMNMNDFLARVDQQMKEERKREAQPVGDRRQRNVTVDVDRRSGMDRRLQARNTQVRRGDMDQATGAIKK